MSILVTGGAGYIGSHTCVELLTAGHRVTVVDNLSNSSAESIERVRRLVPAPDALEYKEVDLCDLAAVDAVFAAGHFDAVIHFAALKAVGESVSKPVEYYENNLLSLLHVLKCMRKYSVKKIVFSSSATVYGAGHPPLHEGSPTGAGILNPYGWTKYMGEQILRDFHRSQPDTCVVLLRYFNPVGAHISGTIGEDPAGIPNNLMPYIQRVAAGKLLKLTVFGKDYATHDGTAVRDYIHVVDLAIGHERALAWLRAREGAGVCEVFNLGTGRGVSVLDMVTAFEAASGQTIPLEFGPRRAGDAEAVWADPAKAERELGWTATRDLATMCADSWRWVKTNPDGFRKAAPRAE